MKKILTLSVLVAVCACHPVANDLEKYALNCKAVELSLQSDTLEFPYTVLFNDKGCVETLTTFGFDGSFRFKESCTYDSKGRLSESVGFNDEQETEIRYEYEYDGAFLRECRVYGMNTQEMHRYVHENDGRHIVRSEYYGEGELEYTMTKTFSGSRYEEVTRRPDGELIGKATVDFFKTETKPSRILGDGVDIEIEYNDKGLPVKSRNVVLNSRGELQWTPDLDERPERYYTYEYDERGNWISRADRFHPDSAAYAVLTRIIRYQK